MFDNPLLLDLLQNVSQNFSTKIAAEFFNFILFILYFILEFVFFIFNLKKKIDFFIFFFQIPISVSHSPESSHSPFPIPHSPFPVLVTSFHSRQKPFVFHSTSHGSLPVSADSYVVREPRGVHSCLILSRNLIGQRENKRFYITEICGDKRQPEIRLRSQARACLTSKTS